MANILIYTITCVLVTYFSSRRALLFPACELCSVHPEKFTCFLHSILMQAVSIVTAGTQEIGWLESSWLLRALTVFVQCYRLFCYLLYFICICVRVHASEQMGVITSFLVTSKRIIYGPSEIREQFKLLQYIGNWSLIHNHREGKRREKKRKRLKEGLQLQALCSLGLFLNLSLSPVLSQAEVMW